MTQQLNRHQRRALEAEARKAQAALTPEDREQMHETALVKARLETRASAVAAAKGVVDVLKMRVTLIKDVLADSEHSPVSKLTKEEWSLLLDEARSKRNTAALRLLDALDDLAKEQEALAVEACSNLVVTSQKISG